MVNLKKKKMRRLKRMPVEQRMHDPLSMIEPVPKHKRPSKHLLDEKICSICLESVSERTKPSSCSHLFCLECIVGWTQYSSACPLCKVPIT
jgi:hypothetical protein